MKKCIKCHIKKEFNEFNMRKNSKDGYRNQCKICREVVCKQYRLDNKEHIKEVKKQYHKQHYQDYKERRKEYGKQYRIDNKEKIKQYQIDNKEHRKQYIIDNKEKYKQYYLDNREHKKEWNKQYQIDNKESIAIKAKQYSQDNKEKIKQWRQDNKESIAKQRKKYFQDNKEIVKKLQKVKYKTDLVYKFRCNIRSLVYQAFYKNGYKKDSRTEAILGCSFEILHNHIERQFNDGMSWENRNEWHLDHIIPLALADTKDEVEILSYYKNLQPLWAKDNLSKGSYF